jgi:hypothetical protein
MPSGGIAANAISAALNNFECLEKLFISLYAYQHQHVLLCYESQRPANPWWLAW